MFVDSQTMREMDEKRKREREHQVMSNSFIKW